MKYDKDGNATPEVETQTIPPREAVGKLISGGDEEVLSARGIKKKYWGTVHLNKVWQLADEAHETAETLLAKFTEQEERLRNMANKLDEHMKERDAHNPGTMGRKK